MGNDLKGKALGTGISQRKDGRYEARFTNKQGRRIRIYSDKAQEIKRKLRDAQYKDENNIDGTGSYVSVEEWSELWMSRYKKHIRHVTRKSYLNNVSIINRYIGQIMVTEVKQLNIQDMVNQLYENGYAISSIKGVKALAYNIFQTAYEDDLIKKNPVKSIKIQFENVSSEVKALTHKEQEIFLKSIVKSHYFELFAFMLISGLRIGEALGLRWKDVNWEKKELKVERDLVYTKVDGSYSMMMENTKTSNSQRIIPLVTEAMQLLERQKAKKLNSKINKNLFDDMIFVGRNGSSCTDVNIRRIMKSKEKSINKNGEIIQSLHPHMLRHTFATRCLESGMNIKTVSKLLGHKRIDTTADIYIHVQPEFAADEMKKLKIVGLEEFY